MKDIDKVYGILNECNPLYTYKGKFNNRIKQYHIDRLIGEIKYYQKIFDGYWAQYSKNKIKISKIVRRIIDYENAVEGLERATQCTQLKYILFTHKTYLIMTEIVFSEKYGEELNTLVKFISNCVCLDYFGKKFVLENIKWREKNEKELS